MDDNHILFLSAVEDNEPCTATFFIKQDTKWIPQQKFQLPIDSWLDKCRNSGVAIKGKIATIRSHVDGTVFVFTGKQPRCLI
jgi:hypothetical protein